MNINKMTSMVLSTLLFTTAVGSASIFTAHQVFTSKSSARISEALNTANAAARFSGELDKRIARIEKALSLQENRLEEIGMKAEGAAVSVRKASEQIALRGADIESAKRRLENIENGLKVCAMDMDGYSRNQDKFTEFDAGWRKDYNTALIDILERIKLLNGKVDCVSSEIFERKAKRK